MKRSRKAHCFIPFILAAALLSVGLASAQTPEGASRIAFVTRNYEDRTMTLAITDPTGANVVTLVTDGYFNNPIWSPDGRQLAFIGAVEQYDDPALWVMNSDGTNLHAVLGPGRTVPDPICAAWSPDGTRFVAGVVNAGLPIYFYTVHADGTGLERLQFRGIPGTIEGVPGDTASPCVAWSPDGNQIAVLGRGDRFPPGQLYLASADGLSAAPVAAVTAEGTTFHQMAWSPDGEKTVLYEFPGISSGMESKPMAIANGDGSAIQAWISAPPNLPGSAAWSPDGSQIVFVANEQGVESMPGGDLWVASADGTNIHTLRIAADVASLGTSWGLIPGDIVLPTAPVSLAEAAQ